ncbi:unnamed protein product [Rotaria sp. Silwood2]|nr:unnamed protein product [Rotaria sp. Silwood2]
MASATTCGLIILGNSGVGKSFLANRLLDDDKAFESRFSARSVTRHTEWKNMSTPIGKYIYSVANIPGFVEANQKLIDENRHEIMKAFEQYPFSIVIFVFGNKGGRIPDEDLVAFMKINDAYQFPPESLLLIVNGILSNAPDDYEEKTAQMLEDFTHIDKSHICFIEKTTSEEDKHIIRHCLHEIIAKCEPTYHTKKHDIELIADEISRLKMEYRQRQDQLLAQEYEYSKRQQLNSTSNPIQTCHRLQQHHSISDTNEPIHESIDHNRRFHKTMEDNQTKHEQYVAHVEKLIHDVNNDNITQLAQQLENTTKQNSALIAQMSPPVTITYETERKTSSNRIKKRIGKVVTFVSNLVLGESQSPELEDYQTSRHDNN